MSSKPVFQVSFVLKKAGTGSFSGAADAYRREPRTCLVAAASGHPSDILAILVSNFPLSNGETYDVLSVQQLHVGGSGANVLS